MKHSSSSSLSSRGLPLSSRGLPLSSRGLPLSSRGLPLSSRGLTTGPNPFDWSAFLSRGYFIGSPLFKKVWCLYHEDSVNPLCALPTQTYANWFYKNNFSCSLDTPWIISKNFFEFQIDDFFAEISKFESKTPKVFWEDQINSQNQKIYEAIFQKIKNEIKKNTIQKIVPCYKKQAKTNLNQEHLVSFLQHCASLMCDKNIFFYGAWDFAQNKLHIGASPELLFIKKKNIVQTIALAGTSTQPKIGFTSKKMKNEHDYVVEDLYKKLQKYGAVKKMPHEIVPYKNFFHQKTKLILNCKKQNPDFETLLASVYPSAAIGAYPRDTGLSFLQALEAEFGIQRGLFAAPFGLSQLADDFMLCISAIRGIEWNSDQLTITAGGGIVAQSSLENEWNEIQLKIQSIKAIFGLSEKGKQ